MKWTFEQGMNAYKAGVKIEEVKVEILADAEPFRDWLVGWLTAQGESLELKYSNYDRLLTKYEQSLNKWEKHIDELRAENMLLKQELNERFSNQIVH
ncbi:hypothetical protein [Marinomonas sp.]